MSIAPTSTENSLKKTPTITNTGVLKVADQNKFLYKQKMNPKDLALSAFIGSLLIALSATGFFGKSGSAGGKTTMGIGITLVVIPTICAVALCVLYRDYKNKTVELPSLERKPVPLNHQKLKTLIDQAVKAKGSFVVQGSSGETYLHVSASKGYCDLIEILIESGESVEAIDSNLQTPLHYAAQAGQLFSLKHLLENHAKISPDINGETPLHYAAMGGYSDCVEELLVHTNTDSLNKSGKTALELAIERCRASSKDAHSKTILCMLNSKCKYDAKLLNRLFLLASNSCSPAVIEKFKQKGAKLSPTLEIVIKS